jgi:hypothetical protein
VQGVPAQFVKQPKPDEEQPPEDEELELLEDELEELLLEEELELPDEELEPLEEHVPWQVSGWTLTQLFERHSLLFAQEQPSSPAGLQAVQTPVQ